MARYNASALPAISSPIDYYGPQYGGTSVPLRDPPHTAQNPANSLDCENRSPGRSRGDGVSIPFQTPSTRKAPWNRKLTELHPGSSPLFKSWRKAEAEQALLESPWNKEGMAARVPHALLKKESWRAEKDSTVEPHTRTETQTQKNYPVDSQRSFGYQPECEVPQRKDSAIDMPEPCCQPSQEAPRNINFQAQNFDQLESAIGSQLHSDLHPRNQRTNNLISYKERIQNKPTRYTEPPTTNYAPLAPLTAPPTPFIPAPSLQDLPTSSTWSGDSSYLLDLVLPRYVRPHPPTAAATSYFPSMPLPAMHPNFSAEQAIMRWLESCEMPVLGGLRECEWAERAERRGNDGGNEGVHGMAERGSVLDGEVD